MRGAGTFDAVHAGEVVKAQITPLFRTLPQLRLRRAKLPPGGVDVRSTAITWTSLATESSAIGEVRQK
jgi:hypothetical protein